MIGEAVHEYVPLDGTQLKPSGKPDGEKEYGVIPPVAVYVSPEHDGPGMHPEPVPYDLFFTPSAKGNVGDDANCSAAFIVRLAVAWLEVPPGVVEFAVSDAARVTGTFVAGNGPALETELVAQS